MAGGGPKSKLLGGGHGERFTPFLLFSCIVASSGGFLFGYDLGISGGVTSTDSFLKQFFPGVYAEMKDDSRISNYCKFDSQLLTLFTSSLYFACLFASLFASPITNKFGRRFSMRLGSAFFFAGAAVGGTAINLHMLILSRLLLGFGVGFTNQSIPLYLSEIAPARYRGAVFNAFEICINGGVLAANLVNYGTQMIAGGWGWRLSFSLASVPAAFLAAGSLCIPETPTCIIQRGGDLQEASRVLQRIRGIADVAGELDDLVASVSDHSFGAADDRPLRTIVRRNYRPHLVMALALPAFQKLTGINLVTHYAPVMFRSAGLKERAALLSAVTTRVAAMACNLVAMAAVDRFGRLFLFFVGGVQMLVSQLIVGGIMARQLGDHGAMEKGYANMMLVFLCMYVAGFGWSWGPLPWMVVEVFPVEIRSVGQSIAVAGGSLFNAGIAQGLLSMLCYMKWGVFFFFAGWVLLMTSFVLLFLPETKGTPLSQMGSVWSDHWYWKRFVANASQ